MRTNMRFDGIPFRPVTVARKEDKPEDPSGRTEYHRGAGRQRPFVPPGSDDVLFVTFLRNGIVST